MNGLAWLFQLKVLALNIRHQIRKVEVQLAGALSTYCTVWWSQVVCTPFSFPTSILNNSWAATFLGDTWQSLFGVSFLVTIVVKHRFFWEGTSEMLFSHVDRHYRYKYSTSNIMKMLDFQKSWSRTHVQKMMKGFVLGLKKKVLLRHREAQPTYEICEHRTQHTMNAFLQRLWEMTACYREMSCRF